MANRPKSFTERTYKTSILPGVAIYRISPMAMIVDQMKRDSNTAPDLATKEIRE